MDDLNNKVCVVTGGAQGIGLGICEALAAARCRVIIADIREEKSRESAENLVRLGYQCQAQQVDVTNEDSVRGMVRSVVERLGRIDVFVASSGIAPNVVPTIRLTTSEWNRVLNVNLLGVFLCCREVGTIMAKQGAGKIINIASLNSVSPAALTAAYNVSKAGVVSLTVTLAIELAPFGVNVNAISPGPIETEFHDVVMPQRAETLGITRREMVEKIRSAIPLGRWGTPSDIAKAVVFLASSQSEWITGQNLIVAGGLAGVAASPSKEVILGKPNIS
jgi:NAD(P)-dependent dehydrogenase (short-subunit alcohol dehydrogenase family)